MKAITLHQPWASLIALNVKTIETRDWQTRYRGPLAIHAGLTRPPYMNLPPLWPKGLDREAQEASNRQSWFVIDTITDDRFKGPQPQGKRIPKTAQTPTLFFPRHGRHGRRHVEGTPATEQGSAVYLPLGAVVATCVLVDCVRTERIRWESDRFDVKGKLVEWSRFGGDDSVDARVAEEQRPFGDYRPGRWAWLLTDIKAIEPSVPERGHQGLWEWTA